MKLEGGLFLIATPIGNLADITLRALETLRHLDLVAAEDTRTAKKLLHYHRIRVPLLSLHDNSPAARLKNLLGRLKRGARIGLISEAGTPGISDPGYRLITAAAAAGIRITPLPGPCAAVAALCAAALPLDSFYFAGFLPARAGARRRRLEALAAIPATLVFYESPRRLPATLEQMLEIFGDRPACVARELTKLYEEFVRLPLSQLCKRGREEAWRGEITLLVAGRGRRSPATVGETEESEAALLAVLRTRMAGDAAAAGLSRRDLVARLAREFPALKRRRVYELVNREGGAAATARPTADPEGRRKSRKNDAELEKKSDFCKNGLTGVWSMAQCDKCGSECRPEELIESAGRRLCEDCYMDQVSPLKACDPWAVQAAKSGLSSSKDGEGSPLLPLQREMLEIVAAVGRITPAALAERLEQPLRELERNFAILRHMELLRGAKGEDGKVYWTLFAGRDQ